MKGFIDSNILIYLLSEDPKKKKIASQLVDPNLFISPQVISENISVCLAKLKLSKEQSFAHAEFLLNNFQVTSTDKTIFPLSIQICSKYNLSIWDSLIVASALKAECSILYSEDMHNGLLIEQQLKIVNPFKVN